MERTDGVRGWAAAMAWTVCLLLPAGGCFEARNSYGGETHFMRSCDERCADEGLACVCGACTKPCEQNATCSALAEDAICARVIADSDACRQEAAPPARACVAGCDDAADCAALGSGFECAAGQCRESNMAGASGAFLISESGGDVEECRASACDAVAAQPLVMLLIDTSGSMERKLNCACTTPACEECLPDCARGERSRWNTLLETLTGSQPGTLCERIERLEQSAGNFDDGYYMPHFALRGVTESNGVLDIHRGRARFGLATFDGWDTYAGELPLLPTDMFDLEASGSERGLWSYNPSLALGEPVLGLGGHLPGSFQYPGSESDYFVDTGVRGPDAAQGALVAATDPAHALGQNRHIQEELLLTRPYGGTPIAAALDDLYYYLGSDPQMELERARPAPKHLVLITDGYPDPDYRDVGCDCASDNDGEYVCGGQGICETPDCADNVRYNPAIKHCPYPLAEDAASALRCGRGVSCDGPIAQLHVVGVGIEDAHALNQLHAIAERGGSGQARLATDGIELRAQLDAILDEVAP